MNDVHKGDRVTWIVGELGLVNSPVEKIERPMREPAAAVVAILVDHGFDLLDATRSAAIVTKRLPFDWRAALKGLSMDDAMRRDFFRQLFGSDAMRAAEVLWQAVQK